MTNLTLPILISICSLAFSVYVFLRNSNKEETSELTTIVVKLENISEGITEIKTDLRSIKVEVNQLRERIAKAEASVSSVQKRVDRLEGKE